MKANKKTSFRPKVLEHNLFRKERDQSPKQQMTGDAVGTWVTTFPKHEITRQQDHDTHKMSELTTPITGDTLDDTLCNSMHNTNGSQQPGSQDGEGIVVCHCNIAWELQRARKSNCRAVCPYTKIAKLVLGKQGISLSSIHSWARTPHRLKPDGTAMLRAKESAQVPALVRKSINENWWSCCFTLNLKIEGYLLSQNVSQLVI